MSVEKATEFEIDHRFDPVKNRHYLNGVCSVLHCHHYATLYTQLALDATDFEGIRHLSETSEDVFYDVLDQYYKDKGIAAVPGGSHRPDPTDRGGRSQRSIQGGRRLRRRSGTEFHAPVDHHQGL